VATPAPDAAKMRTVLTRHLDAVRTLRARIAPLIGPDIRRRAQEIGRLRDRHVGARMIAFAAHAATAQALYGAVRHRGGVVLLAAGGARSAGGPLSRAEILDAFGPVPSTRRGPADDITLVISTDVLHEGVNLQGASVVVHLDLPWTPAVLDQRVGRAARIGSAHDAVYVHAFAPPPGAERLLALGRRYAAKDAARDGAGQPARDAQWIRERVRSWRNGSRAYPVPGEACVRGSSCGFVAVVEHGRQATLVAGVRTPGLRWRVSNTPQLIRRVFAVAGADECFANERTVIEARAALARWLHAQRARSTAGLDGGSSSSARRRVLSRVDGLLRLAPPHRRSALERRLDHVREAIAGCCGAASESALHRLAADATADLHWLEKLESFCEVFQRRPAPRPAVEALAAGLPAVATLLLVVPRPPPGNPRPISPACSSPTAPPEAST